MCLLHVQCTCTLHTVCRFTCNLPFQGPRSQRCTWIRSSLRNPDLAAGLPINLRTLPSVRSTLAKRNAEPLPNRPRFSIRPHCRRSSTARPFRVPVRFLLSTVRFFSALFAVRPLVIFSSQASIALVSSNFLVTAQFRAYRFVFVRFLSVFCQILSFSLSAFVRIHSHLFAASSISSSVDPFC